MQLSLSSLGMRQPEEQNAMTENHHKIMRFYTRFKPHMLMILTQIGYTFMYFFTEASFKHGMNPHVHITYRHVVGAVVLFPFAYFLERKERPKLTLALFAEIFVLSLLGVGLTLNMYFASLPLTSPTFVATMVNTIAVLTFVIAVALRLEMVDVRNPRGLAKVTGTLMSLAGVIIMTFYKGSVIKNIHHPWLKTKGHPAAHEKWLVGSILTVASCISWAMWFIMQAFTLKRYPARLSLTTWMNVLGAAQSAIFTVCIQHEPADWKIGFNVDLLVIIYAGVVCSGLIVYIQLWGTKEKGPVFVTMFDPLSTICVAIIAYFVLGERLYLGSIIGAVIIIIGMYLFLWGKEEQQASPQVEQKPGLISFEKIVTEQ